jgi:hypothetical protein
MWHRFAPSSINTNLIYKPAGYAHMFLRMKEVKETKDIDVLFLGSSHTYRSFDPRIFRAYGYQSFNMGSSMQTPMQTLLLLNRYLNSLNPKLIVYEITPKTFESEGVESSLNLLANDSLGWDSFKMALALNNLKTYNTFLYACYINLFNQDQYYSQGFVRGNDTYIPGGYVESKRLINPLDFNDVRTVNWSPFDYQLQYFDDILKLIRKKNIKIILVQSPVQKHEYDQYYRNNDRIDAYFSGKVKTYLNFNKILTFDDRLNFFDNWHLNQQAVDIFNKKLIEEVILTLISPSNQLKK